MFWTQAKLSWPVNSMQCVFLFLGFCINTIPLARLVTAPPWLRQTHSTSPVTVLIYTIPLAHVLVCISIKTLNSVRATTFLSTVIFPVPKLMPSTCRIWSECWLRKWMDKYITLCIWKISLYSSIIFFKNKYSYNELRFPIWDLPTWNSDLQTSITKLRLKLFNWILMVFFANHRRPHFHNVQCDGYGFGWEGKSRQRAERQEIRLSQLWPGKEWKRLT